jgi:hypothetical protein
MSLPVPSCCSPPVPLIALATVKVSERLKARVALLTTLPLPSVPAVPPLPIWRMPPLMVVVPV